VYSRLYFQPQDQTHDELCEELCDVRDETDDVVSIVSNVCLRIVVGILNVHLRIFTTRLCIVSLFDTIFQADLHRLSH
jgi:hypothetical protein